MWDYEIVDMYVKGQRLPAADDGSVGALMCRVQTWNLSA